MIAKQYSKCMRRHEKPPLAEAQTALGKQKYIPWNAGISPITEIL